MGRDPSGFRRFWADVTVLPLRVHRTPVIHRAQHFPSFRLCLFPVPLPHNKQCFKICFVEKKSCFEVNTSYDLCPCNHSRDCTIHHWLAGVVLCCREETVVYISQHPGDDFKNQGADDKVWRPGFCVFCLTQTEALRWLQRSPGGGAVLPLCLGPERKEGQDPQSAAKHYQPAGDKVNYIHRYIFLFFLPTTHLYFAAVQGSSLFMLILRRNGLTLQHFILWTTLKFLINPHKRQHFYLPLSSAGFLAAPNSWLSPSLHLPSPCLL